MENRNLPVIEVRNLKKHFKVKNKGILHAVDGISFSVKPGETLGLVGESGCGKSTVGNVIMRLHKATEGQVLFKGSSVLDSKGSESMELRKKIQIIFQDPYSSLNPKKTIQNIMEEAYRIHGLCSGKERRDKIEEIIELCGLEKYVLEKYPHELDGGKRQLVGIARALSLGPEFIVCDEPVSSLDVSIQATIINLLMDLQKKMNLSFLFISHDLSVVRHISQRVAVMYLGQIIEIADTDDIFANALHPYTIALLSAVPKIEFQQKTSRIVLKGDVPSPINPGEGCRFAPRCFLCRDICRTQKPELIEVEPAHCVACHFYEEAREKARNVEAGMVE
ncbi:ABC transporter ATP-binding protein [Clostridium sp. Marseille-P2415]|uniref:ABC transporter ATP-binding protein n=1 Tax=Clostridium sp. Marseille-P2415 TaxID=1805471 RepID=UPI0009888A00|nr:oligopeptide/dipeptide ABC transporter ATP-binding protein [Clostridium sp. Marseille-P2415]